MAESEFDRRLQIAELAAAVVALAREAVGVHGLFAHERGDAVSELNLTARAAADALEMLEDRGREHVATDDGERRGRSRGLRLLDDAADATRRGLVGLDLDDAVLLRVLARNHFDAEHARAFGFVHIRHLLEAAHLAANQ